MFASSPRKNSFFVLIEPDLLPSTRLITPTYRFDLRVITRIKDCKKMRYFIFPGLSKDCRFPAIACIPGTIANFMDEVSSINGVLGKISKLDDYVNRLQDEMRKIDDSKNELPLCVFLLNDAIEAMKYELNKCSKNSVGEPVLEEYFPLKKTDNDEKIDSAEENDKAEAVAAKGREEEIHPQMVNALCQTNEKRIPYKEFTDFPSKILMEETDHPPETKWLSLCTSEIKNSIEDGNSLGLTQKSSCCKSESSFGNNVGSNFKAEHHQTTRKRRRCWTPELHRRFKNVLHQLGGAQAAKPKQIRKYMRVEGLTNDEVKSHLQKYRLHTQKVAPTTNLSSNMEPVAPCGESFE